MHTQSAVIPALGLSAALLACTIGPDIVPTSTPSEQHLEPISGTVDIAADTPASAEPLASGCDGPEPPLITSFDVLQTPGIAEPPPRIPFRDPVFGACVTRITDRTADLAPDDPSGGIKNEYSRVQSFNADGSLVVLRGTEATWYVYDTETLAPLRQLPVVEEPRWDASEPNTLYTVNGPTLEAIDARTGETRVVHDFAADFPDVSLAAVWTRYEGSPTFDTRYWGLMAENQDWLTAALLIYDLQTDRVVAIRETPDLPEIETVTISPLGTYFLAFYEQYCEQGQPGTEDAPCGLMVYDRNLQNGRSLLRIIGHADTAVDANGREVVIFQNIDTDHISMLDLESGIVTDLLPIDFSYTAIGLHVSGRASAAPGWALITTHNGGTPADMTWMDDVVFALELKPGGRVVRLAHTHSLVDENQEHDYWAEPHGTVNPDFTRVLFTTNWERSGTDEVETMMITLPAGWLDNLP